MESLATEIFAQWGLVGIICLGAAYVLWTNFKSNKEREKEIAETLRVNNAKVDLHKALGDIHDSLKAVRDSHQEFKEEVKAKFEHIEEKIDKHHPLHIDSEAARLHALSKMGPSIHAVLKTTINNICADHLAIGLLHNGTQSICGTPFMKCDIVAERFYPIHNPQDSELAHRYKDEDLMLHNQLPAAILQNPRVKFEIDEDGNSPLEHIDGVLYRACLQHNIRQIAFEVFRDNHGIPNGFLVAYAYAGKDIDMDEFAGTLKAIESIYKEATDHR